MPLNEREFLLKISKMEPEDFAQAVGGADADEARILRIYLGDEQYEAIHRLATRGGGARGGDETAEPPGNVVVLHGIMGGELTLLNNDGQTLIWVQGLKLIEGQFDRLALDKDGLSARDVIASGIYMRFYGSQIVRLNQDWKVRPFFYDWRQDIRLAADQLLARINSAFGTEAPVHLVAHSMGGLVARAYIAKHPERWNKGGRLVMLGTPNYGSYAIPRLLFGTNDILSLVNKIDFHHSISDLLNIAKTFKGMYQMMPVENRAPGLAKLYQASTYDVVPIDQKLIDDARKFQAEIANVVDKDRMIYVAGYNRRTMAGVADDTLLNTDRGYIFSRKGDGTVPHNLGLLPGVPTFYVDEEHINLPGNKRVQDAMKELLETGTLQDESLLFKGLSSEFAQDRGGDGDGARGITEESQESMLASESARQSAKEQQALALRNLLVSRGDVRGDGVTPEEQALNDLIMRHDPLPMAFAGGGVSGTGALVTAADSGTVVVASVTPRAAPTRVGTEKQALQAPTKIKIRVLECNVQDVPAKGVDGEPEVDCIAVGHYLRVRPTGAERDLDRAISAGYLAPGSEALQAEDLILTQFHDRGILRGELGVPFYLPDPRHDRTGNLIAVIGLGPTGQFGVPELSLASRELCWSLGRMGKKHLATVLIGSGANNLSTSDTIHGWLVGINRAKANAGGCSSLETVTFILRPPTAGSTNRYNDVVTALRREAASMQSDSTYRFEIDLKGLRPVPERTVSFVREEPPATRISIDFENGQCRYSALTGDASIPERVFQIPQKRITDMSDRLRSAATEAEKLRLGKFLLDYLFPRDLRNQLVGNAPIVLACNNEAARVYWELAAQPMEDEDSVPAGEQPFLGLSRGLTRQLRTLLAPPPEPPPPVGRTLRVLVVADGCRERPLPGARREAQLLLDLFDRVNSQGGRDNIAATALIGPAKATPLDVLLEINAQPPYDVLHYAGHCVYNTKELQKSGFLFSGGDILGPQDLDRVDRTPKFVFANACESGVMPSRPDLSSPDLPAVFSEAFFKKGVANFICTAWPVGDIPSSEFALELYRQLLGDNPERSVEPMYSALRLARKKIVGSNTWGAYQHYGNPYFRLFRARASSDGK